MLRYKIPTVHNIHPEILLLGTKNSLLFACVECSAVQDRICFNVQQLFVANPMFQLVLITVLAERGVPRESVAEQIFCLQFLHICIYIVSIQTNS